MRRLAYLGGEDGDQYLEVGEARRRVLSVWVYTVRRRGERRGEGGCLVIRKGTIGICIERGERLGRGLLGLKGRGRGKKRQEVKTVIKGACVVFCGALGIIGSSPRSLNSPSRSWGLDLGGLLLGIRGKPGNGKGRWCKGGLADKVGI